MAKIKGQNIRLAIEVPNGESGTKKVYFAASTTCSLNINADVEDSTTKDDAVNGVAWRSQEVTGKNWDCSAEVQIVDTAGTDGIDGFDLADMVGSEVTVEVNLVTGASNRTKESGLYSGKAIINSWSMTAGNRQTATASVSMQGQGELAKAQA